MQLNQVIDHIRERSYMSGVDREQHRIKATGEVFTPTELVQELLDQIPVEQFQDTTHPMIDPTCGDGQFLGEALIRMMEHGNTFEQALSRIYGVDLMEDNVELCRERLLCGQEDLRPIVENNIVCADTIKYHYRFDGTPEGYLTREELIEKVEELEAIKKLDKAEKHELHKLKGFKKGKEKAEDRANKEKERADKAEAESKLLKQEIKDLKKSHTAEVSELKKSHREELQAERQKPKTERQKASDAKAEADRQRSLELADLGLEGV